MLVRVLVVISLRRLLLTRRALAQDALIALRLFNTLRSSHPDTALQAPKSLVADIVDPHLKRSSVALLHDAYDEQSEETWEMKRHHRRHRGVPTQPVRCLLLLCFFFYGYVPTFCIRFCLSCVINALIAVQKYKSFDEKTVKNHIAMKQKLYHNCRMLAPYALHPPVSAVAPCFALGCRLG